MAAWDSLCVQPLVTHTKCAYETLTFIEAQSKGLLISDIKDDKDTKSGGVHAMMGTLDASRPTLTKQSTCSEFWVA